MRDETERMVGAVKKMEEAVNPREFEALKALPASDKRVLDLPEVGECVFPVAAGVDEKLLQRLEKGYYDQALNDALDAHGGVFGVVKKEALADEVLYPSYNEDGDMIEFPSAKKLVGANRREELRDNPIFDTYLRASGPYGGWRGDQYERMDYRNRELREGHLAEMAWSLRSAVDFDLEGSPEVVAEDLLGLYESVAQRANSATADELADYVGRIDPDFRWLRDEWEGIVDNGWAEPEFPEGLRKMLVHPADVRDYMPRAVYAKIGDAEDAVRLGEGLVARQENREPKPISVIPGDLILEELFDPREAGRLLTLDDEPIKPTAEFTAMRGRLSAIESSLSSEVASVDLDRRPDVGSLYRAVETSEAARSRRSDGKLIELRVNAWLDKRIAQAEKAAVEAAPKRAEPAKAVSVKAAPTKAAPEKPKLDREAYARALFGDVIDAAEAESESGYSL